MPNNPNGPNGLDTPPQSDKSNKRNQNGNGNTGSNSSNASRGRLPQGRVMGHETEFGLLTPLENVSPEHYNLFYQIQCKAPYRVVEIEAHREEPRREQELPAGSMFNKPVTWGVMEAAFPKKDWGHDLPEKTNIWDDPELQKTCLVRIMKMNPEWFFPPEDEEANTKWWDMVFQKLPLQKDKATIPPPNVQGNLHMWDANTIPIVRLPGPKAFDQERHVAEKVEPIAGTTFAPPYLSNMLRQRPELAPGLHHVNCSYLTAKTRPRGAGSCGRTLEGYGIDADAPTLGELKQHAQSLLYLIRHLGFSTAAAEVDAVQQLKKMQGGDSADQSFRNQMAPPNIVADTGVFDFLHDLDQEYRPKETYDKEPLTHLLNTTEWRDNHSDATVNVCPLIRLPAEAISRKQHPMPFARLEALMEHADSALLMIDDALSANGGLLSALPMNLPADDYRRKTFLGQMIHFMRVMVSKVHTLDKAYGSALDCLAGEATVPRYLMTKSGELDSEEDMKTAFDVQQQQYILTGIQQEAYSQIWYEMQKKGAAQAENNGFGLYDVYIPTRYRGLVGGKTVFITPDPARIGEGLAGEGRNIERPTVIAVRKPGPATDTSEWLRKHTAELSEANMWKQRALEAESKIRKLEVDVEYLTPEVMLEEVPGESTRMTATEAWDRVTKKEDCLRLKLLDRSVYAQRNRELEARNKTLEQENDRLTRWREHYTVGLDVNDGLMKENTYLLASLKEAVETWEATDDELKRLRQEIEDRDENAAFELQMLKDAHANSINTLRAQLAHHANANENGPAVVNAKLAIDNTTLHKQNQQLCELLKEKEATIVNLEKNIKELPALEGTLKLIKLRYKNLEGRHNDLSKHWEHENRKYGNQNPNVVWDAQIKVEEAQAELDAQKKENQKLLGKLKALQAKYDNMLYEWEDEARAIGNKELADQFTDLRLKYQQQLQEAHDKIKELKDKMAKKDQKCKGEKDKLR